jgi:uncharacterized membrane protein YkvA (DUF1232 family)
MGICEDSKIKLTWSQVVAVAGDPVRLVRYLVRLLRDERVPKSAKLKLLGAGLYAWIDGDVLPDSIGFIPGLGYVDDIILVVHGVKCLVAETDPLVAAELWPGDELSFERTMTAVTWLDDQLFNRVKGWITSILDRVVGPPPARQADIRTAGEPGS